MPTRKGKIINIAKCLLCFWIMHATLSFMVAYPPHAKKEDTAAKIHVAIKHIIDAAGLQYVSNWQICNYFGSTCDWQATFPESECLWYNINCLHTNRLKGLGHVPGIDYDFVRGQVPYAMKDRLSRHSELAQLAVARFESRFPVDVNTLQNIEDICVDLPRFDARVADILPLFDLFYDWRVRLNFIIALEVLALGGHERALRYISSHLGRAVDHARRILDARSGERFKQLVTVYEEAGCGSRNKRP
ncbi:hypothetical protein F5B21DRAFT_219087 [Xylaria acuta]|nr:hypothetical protein F5B21DRAFT_219087 [Xylaria acuta]